MFERPRDSSFFKKQTDMFKCSVDTIKMISRDIKLTQPTMKDNKQSLIVIRLVRFYLQKLVIFHGP